MLTTKVIMNPWLLAVRLKTLPASISPILLGSALAFSHNSFNVVLFTVAMCCALSLQIAVNFANDYFDTLSGVDTPERTGPVRATQSGLLPASAILKASLLFAGIALCLGFYLVWHSHWQLIWFGVLSLLAVFAYSGGPWPLASNGLGELTVFLFFGWLAVTGAYFIQLGHVPYQLFIYGSVVGCFSSAIMLVNNIRDRTTDAKAHKYTLAVNIGDSASRYLYVVLLLSALLAHCYATIYEGNVWLLYVPLCITVVPACFLSISIFKRKGEALNKQLAQTALLLLLYCLSASIVLVSVKADT
jgi:1,4-dihydroxy-2-naphthoate octaprenyltransferase